MKVDELGCQKVSFVLGAGVLVAMGIPGVIKTSQLSEAFFPFTSFVGILYLIWAISTK
jgi:hypothetical protein